MKSRSVPTGCRGEQLYRTHVSSAHCKAEYKMITLIASGGVHAREVGHEEGCLVPYSFLALSAHTAAPGPAGRAISCVCVCVILCVC